MKDIIKEFKPSSWSIDNKVAIYLMTLVLALWGYSAYNSLPKENFPEIVIPKIFITTAYPGASPENVENLVTKQLEKKMKGLKSLKKITSNSYQGFSMISVEFNANVDIKDAKDRVKDGVDKAKKDLPNDLPDPPEVTDINMSDLPIMNINLSGNYDLKKLKEYADDIKDEIEGMKEISGVDIIGALDREIQINIDANKMASSQISFTDIENAIKSENVSIPGGDVKMDGMLRTINIKKDFRSAEEIANIIIKTPTGASVYLRDIADVKDAFKDQESFARLYGKNVITLNIKKRAGENLIEASDKINVLLKDMQVTSLPKDLKINITGDQSDKTRVTLHDLINTIVIGFVLVTIILMFFMGASNAIFVALSVPLSMCIAFITMPALGAFFGFSFTMNMVVLFSFLLGLGIVVDDAIVVIENTHRIFDNGAVPIKKAAKMAAGEVFVPVLSGTLTTLAPFFPLIFWPGTIGKFMFFLPVTLIITLLASLVVAYIINPVFAVDFMKPHDEEHILNPKFNKQTKKTLLILAVLSALSYFIHFGFGNFMVLITLLWLLNHFVLSIWIYNFQNHTWPRIIAWYGKILTWAVSKPKTMLWSTIALLLFSFVLFGISLSTGRQKIVFFPDSEPNFVYVYLNLPVGTDQNRTNEVTKIAEEKIYKVLGNNDPMISSIISNVTVGVTDPQDEDQGTYTNKAKITIAFVEFIKRNGVKTDIYLTKVRNALKGMPGVEIAVNKDQSGPPTGKPIGIEITGDHLDTLINASNSLKKYLNDQHIGGVEELKSDFQNNKPEILFDIDRERANREGISTGIIGSDLRTAIYGKEVSKFKDVKDDFPINIRLKEDQRNNIDILRNLKVTYRDMGMGGIIRQVPISAFANVDYINSYGGIKRKQEKRIIILSSNVLDGYNANQVVQEIQKAIKNYKAPVGVSIKMGGDQEDQIETMNFLSSAFLMSLALIMVILVALFNSITKPAIILSEILFSITGVLLGMIIFGMDMSIIMTGVGILALAGIVVRNGILLVEFTDLLISQGMDVKDAVIEAGRTRMTPVLLTATATTLGLIPLAVGLNIDFAKLLTEFNPHIFFGGDSVAFWGPLSWTIIFGLIFCTFLTLILVPCMYLLSYHASKKVKKALFGSNVEIQNPEVKIQNHE